MSTQCCHTLNRSNDNIEHTLRLILLKGWCVFSIFDTLRASWCVDDVMWFSDDVMWSSDDVTKDQNNLELLSNSITTSIWAASLNQNTSNSDKDETRKLQNPYNTDNMVVTGEVEAGVKLAISAHSTKKW